MARKRAFRIGRSRTGLGLFATAPIKKRAFIVEYKGRKLTTEQANKLEARGNRYLYEINSRWTIDGTSRKNLGRYVNHSCRPNAETHRIGHKVVIRAIKNIKTGAEITYNYGRDYLINVITRRGCKCDKCRKKRAAARAKARAKSRRARGRRRWARRNAGNDCRQEPDRDLRSEDRSIWSTLDTEWLYSGGSNSEFKR
jgi:SET domain-containing protein